MVLGTVLIVAALALFLFNQRENAQAEQSMVDIMPQLVQQIQENTAEEIIVETIPPWELPQQIDPENVEPMSELEVDGNGYIGCLSLPTLGLELPVMGDWSYSKLKVAPCRYAGNLHTEDLVIMAHNYSSHFGRIDQLSMGDPVLFADVNGKLTEFEVVGREVLPPTAVEEMTSGAYDLTLFTCTYGGANRVTVYCDQIQE
jgi:sortase A